MEENRALIVNIDSVPEIQVPNYEDLYQRLSEEIELYRGYEVTEDNIPEAKKVKANLNSLAKQIEDERKRVKKVYEAPLKDFEAKVKTLSGMVTEVSNEIKEQLDSYDRIRQEKKYAWCEEKWIEIGGETAKLIDYTKLHKPSWMNVTTSITKIEEEMQSALRQINSNIEMIKAMSIPEQERILGTYLTTLDINLALTERAKIVEEKAKVEQFNSINQPEHIEVEQKGFQEQLDTAIEEGKELKAITFTVKLTKVDFYKLSDYLSENGIEVIAANMED